MLEASMSLSDFLEEPIRIAGRKIHGLNAMASH